MSNPTPPPPNSGGSSQTPGGGMATTGRGMAGRNQGGSTGSHRWTRNTRFVNPPGGGGPGGLANQPPTPPGNGGSQTPPAARGQKPPMSRGKRTAIAASAFVLVGVGAWGAGELIQAYDNAHSYTIGMGNSDKPVPNLFRLVVDTDSNRMYAEEIRFEGESRRVPLVDANTGQELSGITLVQLRELNPLLMVVDRKTGCSNATQVAFNDNTQEWQPVGNPVAREDTPFFQGQATGRAAGQIGADPSFCH